MLYTMVRLMQLNYTCTIFLKLVQRNFDFDHVDHSKIYHYRFVMSWTIQQSATSRVGRESEGHGNVWCLSQLEGCIEYALYNYALLLGPFLHTRMIINYCLRKSLILRKRTCWEIWSDIERKCFYLKYLKPFKYC